MNVCVFSGNLVKDPEVKNLGQENAVARFTLAVRKGFKAKEGEPDAFFAPIIAFGKNAEWTAKYLKKGMRVNLRTQFQNNNYEKDGRMVYSYQFVMNEHEFSDAKREGGSGQESTPAPATTNAAATTAPADDFIPATDDIFPPLAEDELPFQ